MSKRHGQPGTHPGESQGLLWVQPGLNFLCSLAQNAECNQYIWSEAGPTDESAEEGGHQDLRSMEKLPSCSVAIMPALAALCAQHIVSC